MQDTESRVSALAGTESTTQGQGQLRDNMAAVEPQSSTQSFVEESAQEARGLRFTAVNTREPLPSAPASNGGMNNGAPRRLSEDKLGQQQQPQHQTQQQPRDTPPGQEKLTITTTHAQRDNWAETVNGGDRNPSHQQSSYAESENPHKRKRSGSFGGERETSQNASTGSYHKHSLPSIKPPTSQQKDSPDTPYPDSAASKRDESSTRDPYATPQTAYPHYSEAHETAASWYSRHGDLNSATSQLSPDDQLREALSRENNSDHYSETSPGQEDGRGASYQGQYGSVQADHKKRKRNFSNRTKTGCMTCRKRKKKCDEARPECQNCIRGGFVCNGYPSRGQWPKTEQKQGPVPLQSKDGYDTSHASPGQAQPPQYHSPSPYQPQQASQQQQQQPQPAPTPQPKREPLPSYRGQQLRVDPLQPPARPQGDDDRASATTLQSVSIGSPDKRGGSLSAVNPYTPANAFPTPISAVSQNSAYSDRLVTMDYQRMPPMVDPSRNDHSHELQTPQSAHPPAVPQISILHPSHSNNPHPHTPQSSAAQDAARLALSHPASNSRPSTQKEEMLAGNPFYPTDRELTYERERCNAASWRFNNGTNPNNGVSREDRERLFRDILIPKELTNLPAHATSPIRPQGYVGTNCEISAPFTCDYGYNINIGTDVLIERNCTIMDCVKVTIGDRCTIGPNVQIITNTVSLDPKKRPGTKGPQFGKPVIIEEDCFIGTGVTILPGITVKRGSTIGAASVVTRDVPAYTIVSGNPARVNRGVYTHATGHDVN